MALEAATHIHELNAANPASTDALAQADDHFRLIKGTLKATFPNVTGAITATHTQIDAAATQAATLSGVTATSAELNVLDGISTGLTSTELSVLDGITASTANLNLVGTLPVVGTLAEGSMILGDSSSVATALPIGTAGYVLLSNGTTATWAAAPAQVPTVSQGQIIVGNASSAYEAIAGTTGQVPTVTSTGTVAFADPSTAADLSLGDVGSYAFLGKSAAGTITAGSTYAGSDLKYAGFASANALNDNTAADIGGASPSGTWRAMGNADTINYRLPSTLFVRIS